MRPYAALLALLLACNDNDDDSPVYVDVAADLPLAVVAQGAALLPGVYVVWQDHPFEHSRAIEVTLGDADAVVMPWRDNEPCLVTFTRDVSDPMVVAGVLGDCD